MLKIGALRQRISPTAKKGGCLPDMQIVPQKSPPRAPDGLRILESCNTRPLTKERQFCNLAPSGLEEIDAISSSAIYPKGAILFVEGREPRGVFVICKGRVKVTVSSIKAVDRALGTVTGARNLSRVPIIWKI